MKRRDFIQKSLVGGLGLTGIGLAGCTSTAITTAMSVVSTTTTLTGVFTVTTSTSYPTAFGIDYAHPEDYLEQGEQSQISDTSVLDSLRSEEQNMAHLGDIF